MLHRQLRLALGVASVAAATYFTASGCTAHGTPGPQAAPQSASVQALRVRTQYSTDLEPGETYYLKGTVGIGVVIGRPRFEFVEPGRGAQEVAECNLLPAAGGAP